jgi:hypothetical protein
MTVVFFSKEILFTQSKTVIQLLEKEDTSALCHLFYEYPGIFLEKAGQIARSI